LPLSNLRFVNSAYTAHATTIAGREGHSETDDKQLSLNLSKPGSGKPGTNPEQLFACGYSACFGSAIDAVAKSQKVAVSEVKVKAEVALNQDDNNGYFLSVVLNVSLAGVDKATAEKLVEAAHQVCPYSKATRGNIGVILQVDNKPLSLAA
jgi:Ohr subfamily peroxiredoxin